MGSYQPGPSGGDSAPYEVVLTAASFNGNTWTNMPLADTGIGATRQKVNLADFTECRMIVQVTTASVAVSSPVLIARYNLADVLAGFLPLLTGAVELQVPIDGANNTSHDSGWQSLIAAARVDPVYLMMFGVNGDGVADPQWGEAKVMFR